MSATERPPERAVPFSWECLVFGMLSVPLAFARHLVSLAVILAVLGVVLGLYGRWRSSRSGVWSEASRRRVKVGIRVAASGLLISCVIWLLWAKGVLPL